MSTTLREFYDVRGDAPDGFAHGQRRGHGLTAAGPSQVQQLPSESQGYGSADRAIMLRAATPEAAAPSRLAELAGHAKSLCQCQGRGLRLASRLCTSTCSLTT
jgi:hypothetical protein